MIIAAATAVRLVFVAAYWGFHTGDDVELVQEALRVARGLEYHPWEIRNLLLPDLLLAPAAYFAGVVGIESVRWTVAAMTVPLALVAALNGLFVALVGRRFGLERPWAATAAAVYSFHWLPLAYGSMVYPRTVAVACVLGAVLLVTGRGPAGPWRVVGAGALVAAAFAMRYSEVIYLGSLAVIAWLQPRTQGERVRVLALLVAGFAIGAIVTVGLVDAATWGRPFASLTAFARYTLVERASSSQVAVQPTLFYLQRALFWVPLPALPLLLNTRRGPGSREAWVGLALPVLALSLIHHKELRYLQGVVPFLALLIVIGARQFASRGRRLVALLLLGLSMAAGLAGAKVVAQKSMAAIEAAEWLSHEPGVRKVVLSQAWAYGDHLILGRHAFVDVATPPSTDELARAIKGADAVCLYERDLDRASAMRAELNSRSFEQVKLIRRARSKTVVVFRRRD